MAMITYHKELGLRARLLLDLIDKTLLDQFKKKYNPNPIGVKFYQQLKKSLEEAKEKDLEDKKWIQSNYAKLFPPDKSTNLNSFDTKILTHLLFTLCDVDVMELLKQRNVLCHTQLSIVEKQFCDLFKKVCKRLLELGCKQKDLDEVERGPLETKKVGYRYHVRSPSADFVGRESELRTFGENWTKIMDNKMDSVKDGLVITGRRSVGKSELVKKYFSDCSDKELNVLWLEASDLMIENSFQDLAENLGLKNIKESGRFKSMKELVKEISCHYKGRCTVFILNNVQTKESDQFKHLIETVVEDSHIVVIATGIKEWQDDFLTMELDVFSESDALKFVNTKLQKKRKSCEEDLKDFVKKCEYHPFHLQQVVASLNNSVDATQTVSDWIRSFKSTGASYDVVDGINDKANMRSQSFQMICDAIKSKDYGGDALDLFSLVCFYNCRDLEKQIILQLAGGDERKADGIIKVLSTYSMIQIHHNDDTNVTYTLPSIELEDIRTQVSHKKKKEIINHLFVEFKHSQNCQNLKHVKTWELWHRHYFYIFNENSDSYLRKKLLSASYRYMDQITGVLKSKGLLHKWVEVLHTLEKHGNLEPDEILDVQLVVAECYAADGNLKDAHKILFAMEDDKEFKDLACEYPWFPTIILRQKTQKALCLKEEGKLDDALEVYKLLENLNKNDTIIKNNILTCLRKKGELKQALTKYKKLVSQLGKERSLFSLKVKANMAFCLHELRQFKESLSIYNEVLDAQEEILGLNNPEYLLTLTNKAVCLQEKGQLEDAMVMYRKILEEQRNVFDETNPMCLTTWHCIGKCLHEQRNYEEAMIYYNMVKNVRNKTLGACHPNHFSVVVNIARCKRDQGEHMVNGFISIKKFVLKILGDSHPILDDVSFHLAKCYFLEEKYVEALELFTTLLNEQKKKKRDRLLLLTKSMIARCHLNLNDFEKAKNDFRKLEKEQRKQYQDKDDSLILETQRYIAQCLMKYGKVQDAYDTLLKIKVQQIELLKENHPSVKDTNDLIDLCLKSFDDEEFTIIELPTNF